MKIMGRASAPLTRVIGNLPIAAHPRFRGQMLYELWDAALLYGIDPLVMVAQSFKETGGGTFGGQVKPEFHNTCGLKNGSSLYPGTDDGDRPLAHARFANWRIGALAHACHLRAYCGAPLPSYAVQFSPRAHLVGGPFVTDVEGLGGRWAPSATYGTEIVTIARRLAG